MESLFPVVGTVSFGWLDAAENFIHDYDSMAKTGIRKLLAGLMIVVGIVLIIMYGLLAVNGGRPSGGMLVVGISDLVVGVVLLLRATRQASL